MSEIKRCTARNPLDCDYPNCRRCESVPIALPETAPMADKQLAAIRAYVTNFDAIGITTDEVLALVAEVDRLRAATVSAGRLREAAPHAEWLSRKLAPDVDDAVGAGGTTVEELEADVARRLTEPPTDSCLICGQLRQLAVWHMTARVGVCAPCRDGARAALSAEEG